MHAPTPISPIFLVCLIFLPACAGLTSKSKTYEGSFDQFTVPPGWNLSWPEDSKGTVLKPKNPAERITMEVWTDYCAWRVTDEQAAQEYLHYVHTMQDPNATLSAAGNVLSPWYGKHTIYRVVARYRSPANERLLVFMSHGSKCTQIELFSADLNRTDLFLPTLQMVVRSFRFK